MIPIKLIEKTLKFTGKKMEDMEEWTSRPNQYIELGQYEFSIEKFCYYLLSPEFIEKYTDIHFSNNLNLKPRNRKGGIISKVGKTIYDYQSGNEQPLIDLLTKI